MPTTKPRHTLTETDELARALGIARRLWPDERPAGLLRRLALVGAETLTGEREPEVKRRLDAIERHAGALTGVYEPGYLQRLRRDWSE